MCLYVRICKCVCVFLNVCVRVCVGAVETCDGPLALSPVSGSALVHWYN